SVHTDGRLPYFSWYINVFIQFTVWTYRQIAKKIGFIKGNQGPWGEWNVVINSPEWEKALVNYSKEIHSAPKIFTSESIKSLLEKNMLSVSQYVNLTQALYHIKIEGFSR